MDVSKGFEQAWPELEKRLRAALAGRRVPVDMRDDILQETGLRLFKTWEKVRPESAWSFTLTIALNLVRDEIRRQQRQDPSKLETPGHGRDAEQDALIRIELERVSQALSTMTERQRAILLAEIGEAAHSEAEGAALKMARSRARKRLRIMLEQVSAFAVFGMERVRRIFGSFDGAFANAVSSVGRPAAVAGLAVVGVLGGFAPNGDAFLAQPAHRPPSVTRSVDVEAVGSQDDAIRRAAAQTFLRPGSIVGASSRPDHQEARANENFGPVRSTDEGLSIDPNNTEFGPYEVEQEFSPPVSSANESSLRVSVRHDGFECDGADTSGTCTGGGRARVTVEANAGTASHEVTVDTKRVANI